MDPDAERELDLCLANLVGILQRDIPEPITGLTFTVTTGGGEGQTDSP